MTVAEAEAALWEARQAEVRALVAYQAARPESLSPSQYLSLPERDVLGAARDACDAAELALARAAGIAGPEVAPADHACVVVVRANGRVHAFVWDDEFDLWRMINMREVTG